jgi:hypothetical protein
MTSWKKVWHDGIVPQLPQKGLEALRDALLADSEELQQGFLAYRQEQVAPNHAHVTADEGPVNRACAVGLCLWKGYGLTTIEEVRSKFNPIDTEAAVLLNDRGDDIDVRAFYDFFDSATREELRSQFLPEVEAALRAGV